jgi:hypothetical protein
MFVRCLALISLAAAPAIASAQSPTAASVSVGPEARALFERDWVLMNWALKFYDNDHDMLLSEAEAEGAAAEFRRMADTNHDGRITPDEYRAARALVLARD